MRVKKSSVPLPLPCKTEMAGVGGAVPRAGLAALSLGVCTEMPLSGRVVLSKSLSLSPRFSTCEI